MPPRKALMLKFKKVNWDAKAPTVGHIGEDLAYDLYCAEDARILPWTVRKIGTGIAAVFDGPMLLTQGSHDCITKWGLLIQDRSSVANISLFTIGGVVDSGYRGEIMVMLANFTDEPAFLPAGTKIAQMIPTPVLTQSGIVEVAELPESSRGVGGFGSTGK
jgi:dUTP pyrophosphatase